MKTRFVSLITALVGLMFTFKSQADPESDGLLSGSFTTRFNTAYIGKIGTAFYRSPTVTNMLDINIGKDWTAELWSSTALGGEGYGKTHGDEIDLLVTWHHQFKDFKVSLTGGYFAIKDLSDFKNDLWIAEAEVSYSKYAYFQPYISARYFGRFTSKSPDDGWFVWAGVRGSFKTVIPRTKLTADVSIAYSDGALGRDAGLVFSRVTIGLPIKASKKFTITPSVLLQAPIGNQRSYLHRYTDRNEVVGSLGFSFGF